MASRTDLLGAAQVFSPDAHITRAFSAVRGLRPGLEAFAAIVALVVAGYLPHRNVAVGVVISAALCGMAVSAVVLSRTPFVIATTGESVLVLRCARLRPNSPVGVVQTVPRAHGIELAEGGDRAVTVGGDRYWVWGVHGDEARKAALDAE